MAQVMETNNNRERRIRFFVIIPLLTFLLAFLIFSFVTKTLIFAEQPRTQETNYTYSMEEIIVNLKEGNRYFKGVIALGYNLPRDQELITESAVQIRDSVLTVIRNKSAEELLEPKNEKKLKDQLRDEINKLFDEDIITDIYFADFLIQ